MDTKGEGGGGMNWEIGIDIYTLLTLCIKQITNENLLYNTGNSTQRSGDLMERKSKKGGFQLLSSDGIQIYSAYDGHFVFGQQL